MAKITFVQRIDRNKFMKTYPFIQRTPRFAQISNTGLDFEFGQVCFSGSHVATYTFEKAYTLTPTIVLSPHSDDVAIWITNISLTSVTFEASAPTSACVDFQSIFQGS